MWSNEFDVWFLNANDHLLCENRQLKINEMWNLMISDFLAQVTPTILKTLFDSRNVYEQVVRVFAGVQLVHFCNINSVCRETNCNS